MSTHLQPSATSACPSTALQHRYAAMTMGNSKSAFRSGKVPRMFKCTQTKIITSELVQMWDVQHVC